MLAHEMAALSMAIPGSRKIMVTASGSHETVATVSTLVDGRARKMVFTAISLVRLCHTHPPAQMRLQSVLKTPPGQTSNLNITTTEQNWVQDPIAEPVAQPRAPTQVLPTSKEIGGTSPHRNELWHSRNERRRRWLKLTRH